MLPSRASTKRSRPRAEIVTDDPFNPRRARAKRPCPFWIDAFLRDTQHLEADEVGAYFLILSIMWTRETLDFPADDKRLARAARVSTRLWRARIGPAIRCLFTSSNDVIYSESLVKAAEDVERRIRWHHGSRYIPIDVREAVILRDGFRCRYCGEQCENIHLDHVLPWSRGGCHTTSNIVVSCPTCNLRKSAKTPDEAGMLL